MGFKHPGRASGAGLPRFWRAFGRRRVSPSGEITPDCLWSLTLHHQVARREILCAFLPGLFSGRLSERSALLDPGALVRAASLLARLERLP